MPYIPNANYLADEQLEEMLQDMIARSSVNDVILALENVLREKGLEAEADLLDRAAQI